MRWILSQTYLRHHQGDLEILVDLCYEAPFNVLPTSLRQAMQMGYVLNSKVLDIDSLDLAMGKMMEQGPVLVITFNSQQILCVKDREGKVTRVTYVWVLCRDQTELDPTAAWRLLDLSANSRRTVYIEHRSCHRRHEYVNELWTIPSLT